MKAWHRWLIERKSVLISACRMLFHSWIKACLSWMTFDGGTGTHWSKLLTQMFSGIQIRAFGRSVFNKSNVFRPEEIHSVPSRMACGIIMLILTLFWNNGITCLARISTQDSTESESTDVILSSLYTEIKKFSKICTSLVFVYKSMSLKRFRIEQLCPSIDSMISLVFVHYAIM